MSEQWQQAQVVDLEGSVLLTVFDGEEIISIELMESYDVQLAESCAVSMGFGVAVESV
jgi:hypothetical protein